MQTLEQKKTNGFKLSEGIRNIFSPEKENDKASESYKLNPSDPLPETETFEQSIDRKKLEIERMGVELEVKVAEIEHKKEKQDPYRESQEKDFQRMDVNFKNSLL
jgi:hypothetical protein